MPEGETQRRAVIHDRDLLLEGTGRDSVLAAALLHGILYLGSALENLRDDLRARELVEEERHRDLLAVLAPPVEGENE